jgi:uncharacterized protein
MATQYRTPGVYREDIFLKPQARLVTGVPGFVGLTIKPSGPSSENPAILVLHRKEELSGAALGSGFLADAVAGFFDNGGERCYVALAAYTDEAEREEALVSGIKTLAQFEDLELLAAPDAMTLRLSSGAVYTDAVKRVQQAMLQQCALLGARFAILDAPPETDLVRLLQYRNELTLGQAEPVNGAFYYPWIKVTSSPRGRFVPPSGHVAGVYARADAKGGVFKAPANEEVLGAVDIGISEGQTGVGVSFDGRLQDQLNPAGINCLRAFPGRGIRVWGARTLSREPEWRYINVRRLFLTLRRWVDQNMAWASHEPNEPRLWVRIQRELTVYLTKLWRDGALIGSTPEEAFYVKCDAETNPPEQREQGQVVTEIGLAPGSPAEFIVVRIMHRSGTAETLEGEL